MFFSAKNGSIYPVSRIARIHPAREGGDRHRPLHLVDLTEDQSVEAYDFEIERIVQVGRVIPASPGFSLVHIDGREVGPIRAPVIGWAIDASGNAAPITPDGINDGVDSGVTILTPAGQVIQSGNAAWESLESFLKEQSASD